MDSFDREQYLKELRMYYSGDRDDIEKFLEEVSESLDCYLEANPSATTAEIFKHFGHPRELQRQYEQAIWKHYQKRKQDRIRIAIVMACIISVTILGFFIFYKSGFFIEANGYGVETLRETEIFDTPSPIESDHPISHFYLRE